MRRESVSASLYRRGSAYGDAVDGSGAAGTGEPERLRHRRNRRCVWIYRIRITRLNAYRATLVPQPNLANSPQDRCAG